MEAFSWSDDFKTGEKQVDEQHQHLFDLINEYSELLSNSQLSEQNLAHIIAELKDYSVKHFQDEESLMAEMAVDPRHLDAHRKSHGGFLEDLLVHAKTLENGDTKKHESFLKFLTCWLVYHIMGIDQTMAKQIAAIRKGLSPAQAFETVKQREAASTDILLSALHGLFHQVSVRGRELHELNETLEQRVIERTQELNESNRKLEHIALTDALTSMPNRRHAMQFLRAHWDESSSRQAPLSCMMIDADFFKQINDQYGHDAGDEVLIKLGETFKDEVRTDDMACRLGGDEFFIICPDTDLDGAWTLASKIHQRVNALQVIAGAGVWQGSISVGVASRSPEMTSVDDLIKRADKGVYMAKDAGKNCVRSAQKVTIQAVK